MNLAVYHHEKRFEFRDTRYPASGISFCQVDIYFPIGWRDKIPCGLVMLTNPGKGSGVSITNASETIAQKVWETYLTPEKFPDLNPAMVVWVEKYPGHQTGMGIGGKFTIKFPATYDQIRYSYTRAGARYNFHNPQWRPIKVEEIEKTFGVKMGAEGIEGVKL